MLSKDELLELKARVEHIIRKRERWDKEPRRRPDENYVRELADAVSERVVVRTQGEDEE